MSTATPELDLETWQEVFETSIRVGASGLAYMSPTIDSAQVPVASGRFALRASGRGFVARGWPGSPTPGDDWLVQLWPTMSTLAPKRLARWDDAAAIGSRRDPDMPLQRDAEKWAKLNRQMAADPWHQLYLAVAEFRDIQRSLLPVAEPWLRRAEIGVVERASELSQWLDAPELMPPHAIDDLRRELALVEREPQARLTAWPDRRDRVLTIGRLALRGVAQL